VIVLQINICCVVAIPAECDPPIAAGINRIAALLVTAQSMKAVSWINLGPDKVTNEAVDFTAAMNSALTNKTAAEWQLYWQFSGNNTDTVGFWGCRIDLGWIVG
jgi:hypothetical protein